MAKLEKPPIPVGSTVVCPVTDKDGEIAFAVGTLIEINCRIATVDIDNKIVKVGKTKIDLLMDINHPKLEHKDRQPVMPRMKSKVQNYTKCVNASGRKSVDNGDRVAALLRGETLDRVYEIAAQFLEIDESVLRERYKTLNPGHQRMCIGNRLRKHL